MRDACDGPWRVHNRWFRFPVATKVTARALSLLHVSSADAHVRQMSNRELMTRATSCMQILFAWICMSPEYYLSASGYFSAEMQLTAATENVSRDKTGASLSRFVVLFGTTTMRWKDAAVRSVCKLCGHARLHRDGTASFLEQIFCSGCVSRTYIYYIRTDTCTRTHT